MHYDVAIIGGGMAGLSLAIQLAGAGHSVVLLEKEKYPFHKVCGEYISMEAWDFLEGLGIPLSTLDLPRIRELELTAADGTSVTTPLPLGGFGISRYRMDQLLFARAKEAGVLVLEETKAEGVECGEEGFSLRLHSRRQPGLQSLEARLCCGAYGKRSNLDVRWKRAFLQHTRPRLDNDIAVKYHVRTAWPQEIIGLHNFSDGYCGISKIEGDTYCLCYLTRAHNLRRCGNSISRMEEEVLYRNPVLKKIFGQSEVAEGFPVTISQVAFGKKSLVEAGVLMVGDTAGLITPLCGNGMSMALHGSKMAAAWMGRFLQGRISRDAMEKGYQQQWRAEFETRMQAGRLLQRFFGSPRLSNGFVRFFRAFPFLARGVIKKTHGAPF
jgi:menaquinone-9 beta-reductase